MNNSASRTSALFVAFACGWPVAADAQSRFGGPTDFVDPSGIPCGGHWRALELGIQAPRGMQAYPRPKVGVYVSTPKALIAALNQTTPQTIVLAPGTFDRPVNHPAPSYPYTGNPPTPTFVTARAGHTVVAEQVGLTRLKFGVSVPAIASGFTLRGVVFDIDHELDGVPNTQSWFEPRTWFTSAVLIWGGASDVTIEDVRVLGNQRLHQGIRAPSVEGLQIHRVAVYGVRRFGLLVGNGSGSAVPVTTRPIIEDVVVDGVTDPAYEDYIAPLGNDYFGQQLHGIMLATPCDLRRVRVRRVAHSGIALGNTVVPMEGALLEDIDVDAVNLSNYTLGTGVYFERQQLGPRLRRFCVGPDVDRGVHIEWGHAANSDATAAQHCNNPLLVPIPSDDVQIDAGVVLASRHGVYVGAWTRGTRIRTVHFENAWWAAVGAHDNLKTGGTNTATDNLTFASMSGCRYTIDNGNVVPPQCLASLPTPSAIPIPYPCSPTWAAP